MRILIAEDTEDLNRVVTAMLNHAGYDVDQVYDGMAALEAMDTSGYDAVILDIMMPKLDGISVLRNMRERNILTPVLLLTAKAEIDDRVEGLEAGADDYLPKPFAMKELLARIKAMTRRTSYNNKSSGFANYILNGDTLELIAENTVRLSLKEYEVLSVFTVNAGKELTTEYILERIWGNDTDKADVDTIYLYVNYLRRKLKGVAAGAYIDGERGGSYILKSKD
ncbi:MAG: response regulator transcription factor [Lachnospiraceae bacterium]|nr:response regulator transcription factor [Lachnospiraceae bacterium]